MGKRVSTSLDREKTAPKASKPITRSPDLAALYAVTKLATKGSQTKHQRPIACTVYLLPTGRKRYRLQITHELIQKLVPRHPAPDALPKHPQRDPQTAHREEARAQDIEDCEGAGFLQPALHEVAVD